MILVVLDASLLCFAPVLNILTQIQMPTTFAELQSFLREFNAEWCILFIKAPLHTITSGLTDEGLTSTDDDSGDDPQALSYLVQTTGSHWTVLIASVGHYSSPGGDRLSELFGEVWEYGAESTSSFEGITRFKHGEPVKIFATEDFEEFLDENEIPFEIVKSLGEVFDSRKLPILPATPDQSFKEFLDQLRHESSNLLILRMHTA